MQRRRAPPSVGTVGMPQREQNWCVCASGNSDMRHMHSGVLFVRSRRYDVPVRELLLRSCVSSTNCVQGVTWNAGMCCLLPLLCLAGRPCRWLLTLLPAPCSLLLAGWLSPGATG